MLNAKAEKKNVAVLVSGSGTNLQALINAQKRGKLKNANLSLVISSKTGAGALSRAKKAGIETAVIEKKKYKDRAEFTKAIINELRQHDIRLIVMAGFTYILSPEFTEIYKNRVINVHPALIPAFCGEGYYGLHVHEAVLEYGVKITGATVHIVNEVTDGGPVILQKAIEVRQEDTPETLQKRVMRYGEWRILPEAVSLFCEDRLIVEDGKVRII